MQADAASGGGAAAPGVLVILGASGDLTKRLLMPALVNLACDGLLPASVRGGRHGPRGLDTAAFRGGSGRTSPAFTRGGSRCKAVGVAGVAAPLHRRGFRRRRGLRPAPRPACWRSVATAGASGNTLLYLAISPEFRRDGQRAGSTRPDSRGFRDRRASSSKSRSARIWPRRSPSTSRCSPAGGRTRSTASTITSGRRRCRTCWPSDWPTACSSRCGTPAHRPHPDFGHRDRGRGDPRRLLRHDGRGPRHAPEPLLQMLAYVCMEPPRSVDPALVREREIAAARAVRIPGPERRAARLRPRAVRRRQEGGCTPAAALPARSRTSIPRRTRPPMRP